MHIPPWYWFRSRRLKRQVDERIAQLTKVRQMLAVQLQQEPFLSWFFENGSIDSMFGEAVVHGCLPLGEAEFIELMGQHRVQYSGMFRADVEVIISGREGWDAEDMMRQLDLRTGRNVRVYSQEMALAFLGCGKDPLKGGDGLLRYFANDHPALKFLQTLGFPWPLTEAFPGINRFPEPDWTEVGLLSCMGYHVGRTGKMRMERMKILRQVLELRRLPQEYVHEWGTAESAERLHKMADSIASFARLKKRDNRLQFEKAIKDWEDDLEWLKSTYYTGRFRFQWPTTF